MNPTELAYRTTAVQGSSGFGLLIALYDTLAGNLRRAAEAQRNNDIQKRCQEVNHALLVIGYLEDWIDREGGGELAIKLVAFYSSLRTKLIQAQVKESADLLELEMGVIIAIRGTWQDLESRAASALEGQFSDAPIYLSALNSREDGTVSSWSA